MIGSGLEGPTGPQRFAGVLWGSLLVLSAVSVLWLLIVGWDGVEWGPFTEDLRYATVPVALPVALTILGLKSQRATRWKKVSAAGILLAAILILSPFGKLIPWSLSVGSMEEFAESETVELSVEQVIVAEPTRFGVISVEQICTFRGAVWFSTDPHYDGYVFGDAENGVAGAVLRSMVFPDRWSSYQPVDSTVAC